jgi:plastocyanin
MPLEIEPGSGKSRIERRSQMRRTILVFPAALLALAAVGTAAARPSATEATTVKVTAKDFYFKLSTKTVKPGRVTFVIRNASSALHDFMIAGRRSTTIGPGKPTRLTVTLKPGRYPYKCTVDSHAELGMKGVLRVQR